MTTKPQSYTKTSRQQRNVENGRKSSQGRAHQLALQYQMVSPESTHTSSVMQMEQVVSIYLKIHTHTEMYTHTHTYNPIIKEKGIMNLKESKN